MLWLKHGLGLHRIESLTSSIDEMVSLTELGALWIGTICALGFEYAILGTHTCRRGDPDGFAFHNYPDAWAALYIERRYHEIDPVLRRAENDRNSFFWNDPAFITSLNWRQRQVLIEARRHGLRYGRTYPLASSERSPASFTLIAKFPEMAEDAYRIAQVASLVVYNRARQLADAKREQHQRLRPKERLCLELAARGLDDSQIAAVLNKSEAAVRRAIERARSRLGARSRTQAAAIAAYHGQIRPWPCERS